MRAIIYLIVSQQGVLRMRHTPHGTTNHGERPMKVVVNIPNAYFILPELPALQISIPEEDLLAPAAVEVTATLLPEQETA